MFWNTFKLLKRPLFSSSGTLKYVFKGQLYSSWQSRLIWMMMSCIFLQINKNEKAIIHCQTFVEEDKINFEANTDDTSCIFSRMNKFIWEKQSEIIKVLEELNGKKFIQDVWEKDGMKGKTYAIESGNVFEKGGVNVTTLRKKLTSDAIERIRKNHQFLKNTENLSEFSVCGLSLILHPHNPMVPSIHMNYRYIEVDNKDGTPKVWWFGGGSDLTPSYLFDEDAIYFHTTYKEICDRYDKEYYPKFKKWCDEYFYIKHRKECRGIGGIFFDDLDYKDPEEIFSFVKDCLNAFVPSYIPIVLRRKDMDYTADEKHFQRIRYGRYVEFNLMYDRGTAFGLHVADSRIESILVSMPSTSSWVYRYSPKDPREIRFIEILQNPREWAL